MYRVNPFTYVVESFLGTTLANAPVECAVEEIVSFNSPSGLTCEEYTAGFIERAGGYLVNDAPPGRGDEYDCHYCSLSNTNDFLASINMSWDNRWRNFGFMWAYIAFNVAAAFLLYWLVRVKKGGASFRRRSKIRKALYCLFVSLATTCLIPRWECSTAFFCVARLGGVLRAFLHCLEPYRCRLVQGGRRVFLNEHIDRSRL